MMMNDEIKDIKGYEWYESSLSVIQEGLSLDEIKKRIKMIADLQDKVHAKIVLTMALEELVFSHGWGCGLRYYGNNKDTNWRKDYYDIKFELHNALWSL